MLFRVVIALDLRAGYSDVSLLDDTFPKGVMEMMENEKERIAEFRKLAAEFGGEAYQNKVTSYCYDSDGYIHLLNLYYLNAQNIPVHLMFSLRYVLEDDWGFEVAIMDEDMTTLFEKRYLRIENVSEFIMSELTASQGSFDWKEFMKTNVYKVFQTVQYDDLYLEFSVGLFDCPAKKIDEVATQRLSAVLTGDGLQVSFGERQSLGFGCKDFLLKSHEQDEYHFEICTKELPPPIDATTLSGKDIVDLLEDERYMTDGDDYARIDWDFTKAYNELKKKYPDKDSFPFDSLAYRTEVIEDGV